MCAYCVFLLIVYSMCSFSTLILLVGSFDQKNRRPYNLYCVGGDVKPCSIQFTWKCWCLFRVFVLYFIFRLLFKPLSFAAVKFCDFICKFIFM